MDEPRKRATGPLRVGDMEVWALDAGRFWLDGGTMFGVVPKALWEKRIPADDHNRICLGLTCLLVRTGKETVLIESGHGGAKLKETLRQAISLEASAGLDAPLAEIGVTPGEVDRVILTHLHPDHAGGCTRRSGNGVVPAFPNARYVVQREEWADATGSDRQIARAYFAEADLLPLDRAGVLDLFDGAGEVVPGIRVALSRGHTRAHQSVLVSSGEETLCFIGDLVPTRHHMPPAYIMAFDLYPRLTYATKERVLTRAAKSNWLVVWPHDPDVAGSRIRTDDRGRFIPVEEL
jgi:glyoxylase-like metal-dependent hydrolase (beta-lactamase superfamily II)